MQLRHRTLLHRKVQLLRHRKLLLDLRCGQREQGEVWHCRLLGMLSRLLLVALRHSDGRARQGGCLKLHVLGVVRHAQRTGARLLIQERCCLLRVPQRHCALEHRLHCHVRLGRFGSRPHLAERVERGQRGALGALRVDFVELLCVIRAHFHHHLEQIVAVKASPAPARRAAARHHTTVAEATAV